jgi:LysR family hydrogen peroxide-inducible transcriptional activator
MPLEIHQLRYFVAVAETGSFTQAAERVGVTQPTLSEQIMRLESRQHGIGQRLFDRLGRKIVLTEAGHRLLQHAQRILAAVQEAERALHDIGEQGVLHIGAIPTVAPFVLPKVLARFRKEHRLIQVHLIEDVTERLLAALHRGELDIAIMALPQRHEQLHVEPLKSEPLVAALPQKHRLAQRETIRWADLKDEPFILLHEIHCLGEQVLSLCRREGMEPRVVCQGEQIVTLLQLVAAGLGVTIVPEMAAVSEWGRGCIFRMLQPPVPQRTLCAVWHKHRYRPPVLLDFIRLLYDL